MPLELTRLRVLAGSSFVFSILLTPILASPALAQATNPRALATVDGVVITKDDVDKVVGTALWPLEERIYRIQEQAVDALIKQRLLEREAARRKVSLQALIDSEVTAKVAAVTDEEIDRAKASSKSTASREEVGKALLKERVAGQLRQFVGSLESKRAVKVLLEPPRAPRAVVEGAGALSRGPADAPVTIVEFTDFHCTYCRQAESVLSQVLAKYPVRLVHRDLPLDGLHPNARAAHEAARCADAQGKFWAYRDALFDGSPKSGADLTSAARMTSLDVDAFDRCIAAGVGKAAIEKDAADAKRLGVTSTPTIFVNGRELTGPATFDAIVAAVQNELPRNARSK